MVRMAFVGFSLIFCIVLSACTPSVDVVPGQDGAVTFAAYESIERGAYIVRRNLTSDEMIFVCAEPPPDTAANTRLSLGAGVDLGNLLGGVTTAPPPVPDTATAEVTATPVKAEVAITDAAGNVTRVGSTERINLTPGSYTVQATAEGFAPDDDTFVANAGDLVAIDVSLLPEEPAQAPEQDQAENDASVNNDNRDPIDINVEPYVPPPPTSGPNAQLRLQTARDIVNFAERTELVEIQRQALYRICELGLNGLITQDQAFTLTNEVLFTIRVLALAELINAANANPGTGQAVGSSAIDQIVATAASRGAIVIPFLNKKGTWDVAIIEPDGDIKRAALDAYVYDLNGVVPIREYDQNTLEEQLENSDAEGNQSAPGQNSEFPGSARFTASALPPPMPAPALSLSPQVYWDLLRPLCKARPEGVYPESFRESIRLTATTYPEAFALILSALANPDRNEIQVVLDDQCETLPAN